MVNLWVGEGGETTPVDVWVRRSFTAGPVLLADDIRFGDATPYLAAPPGAEVVVVTAGAGPDGRARADLAAATAGEQLTTVFTNDDLDGTVVAPTMVERGGDLSLVPPTDDQGLIVVFAPNLGAFADRLEAELGGGSLAVGDGSSACRTQRFEADGFPADVVGGVRTVELEVSAGPAAISLHPASSADCGQPSVLDLTVDMEPGAITIVLAFTRDGATIEALTLPVAPLT